MGFAVCFDNPPDAVVAIGGGDAAIVSGDSDRLLNNNPGATISSTWATTSSTATTYDMIWTTPRVPKLVGIQNCTLPIGTKIQFSFHRTGDSGYPYPATPYSGRIVARERGEQLCWVLLPDGLDAATGMRTTIPNDVFGSATIAAGQAYLLGDIRCLEGFECNLVAGEWNEENNDTTNTTINDLMQRTAVRGVSGRILTFQVAPLSQLDALGGGGSLMPTGIDYKTMIARIDRAQTCVIVERFLDDSGAYSQDLVNRTALFGYLGKNASMKFAPKSYASGDIVVNEIPIPA